MRRKKKFRILAAAAFAGAVLLGLSACGTPQDMATARDSTIASVSDALRPESVVNPTDIPSESQAAASSQAETASESAGSAAQTASVTPAASAAETAAASAETPAPDVSSSAAEEEGSETVETNYLTFTLPDRLGAVVTYGITYGDDPLLDVTLSVPGDGPGGDAAYLANLVLFPEGDDVSLIAGGRVLGTMTDGKQTGTLMLLVPTDVECMPSAQADYDAISARLPEITATVAGANGWSFKKTEREFSAIQ